MTMVLDAADAATATADANRRGLLVERCDPEAGAMAPQLKRWAVQLGAMTPQLKQRAIQLQAVVSQKLRQAWAKRWGRISLVTAPLAIIITTVVLIVGNNHFKEMRRQINAQIDAGYQSQMKGARALGEQAEDDFRRAAELRREAAQLRAESAANMASGASAEKRVTKREAMAQDAFIQIILDRYPDLKWKMLNKSDGSLDVSLNLLVSVGKLAPSDVRYIRNFATMVRSLPD